MANLKVSRVDESVEARIKIDYKDEKILSLLSENSRMPITAISRKIKLSKEGTFYRINKLQKQGVIKQFIPIFDLRDFGFHTYHVFMVIDESNIDRKNRFLHHLLNHRSTRSIMEYSDRWDIEWVLAARNVQDFDHIMTDLTKDFADIIIEKHKFEIIIGYKSLHYPTAAHDKSLLLGLKKPYKKQIDAKSMQIIEALCHDARLSTYEIAEKIGVSADTVSYRIKKLQQLKIIRQFSIMTGLSSLGYHWHTMCINLRTFDLSHELKFKEYISNKPEILRAVKVLGDWDLMLNIVIKNFEDLHRIVKDIYRNFVDVIVNYQTWSGYKEHSFTSLPKIIEHKD